MLFTAPSFLFLFLPAVLAIYALIPQLYRRYAILLFNLAFYVIAAWHQPDSILLGVLTAAFTYSAGFVIAVTHRRSTLLAAIAVDLAAFIIYRVSYDYTADSFYPLGASIYLLASISYLIDIYRNDAPHAKNIADLLVYMFFFPTMIVGPIIRYKEFGAMLEKIEFSLTNVAEGIKLYLAGFFKFISISAVLAYMLQTIAQTDGAAFSLPFFLLTVILTAIQAFFALIGYSDMARGLMYMLGIPHPTDFQLTTLVRSPADFPRRFFASLNRWIEDYLVYPILRLSFFSGRIRRLLAVCVICLVPALWIKSRLYLLLPLLPLLLWRSLAILHETGRRHETIPRRRIVGRMAYMVILLVSAAGFWYAVSLTGSEDGLVTLRRLLDETSMSIPYAMYGVISQLGYLTVGTFGLLCFIPLSPTVEQYLQRLPRPVGIMIRAAALIGVMGCFAFSILCFLPQFPQYATDAFSHVAF